MTGAAVSAALQVAVRTAEASQGPLPTRLCVVAMGRFGGHETGYGSDADVMFVHDPLPGADEEEASRAAHAVAEDLRALLARAGARPAAADRPRAPRPRASRARWCAPWPPTARTTSAGRCPGRPRRCCGPSRSPATARWAPGSPPWLTNSRYPAGGIPDDFTREIRRIKARMEAERMPGASIPRSISSWARAGCPTWSGWCNCSTSDTRTRCRGCGRRGRWPAWTRAAGAGLVGQDDAAALAAAWRMAARVRDAAVLVRGRPSDMLPTRQPELAAVASVLGYAPEAYQDLEQDYRRAARRARAVMERLFYGSSWPLTVPLGLVSQSSPPMPNARRSPPRPSGRASGGRARAWEELTETPCSSPARSHCPSRKAGTPGPPAPDSPPRDSGSPARRPRGWVAAWPGPASRPAGSCPLTRVPRSGADSTRRLPRSAHTRNPTHVGEARAEAAAAGLEPAAVVGDVEGQAPAPLPDPQDERGPVPGVLAGVLDGFQAAEVDRRLDLRRVAAERGGLHRDRQRRPARGCGEGGRQPALGEQRRIDAVREVPQPSSAVSLTSPRSSASRALAWPWASCSARPRPCSP